MPQKYPHDHENDVVYFGKVNFRNTMKVFGIKTDDRRRHMYVIGKTGMGKTTLLENLILSDIYAGHGCCYVDPHGDTAEKIIERIPSWRINDVVYFNPSDLQYPVGFNILESIDPEMKHLVAAGLMGVFKKIWEGVWSARMEYIMNNTILALLDTPGTTLLGINRMLSDADYRKSIIQNIQDPIVKQFWIQEFGNYQDKFASEAVAPIQNKVGQFLSASIIRNIVAQAKSTINIREIMDEQKIFIVNLSKGRVGEDASRLLGGMLITKIQTSAMERVDIPEEERQDFYMYVDEFQNFAVESFASILSEARKYRLNLIMAHQYIAQLTEEVRDAVFGNVGTIVTFRVGSPDAQFMEPEFVPRFTPEDLINLPKYNIYLKLMIDGVTSQPFSALTLPPIAHETKSRDRVIAQSRERYAGHREKIESKVFEWSGFGDDLDVEKAMKDVKDKKKAAKKQKYMHTYECTRCGVSFDLPVELDKSRPIYCENCHPIIQEERKKGKNRRNAKPEKEKKIIEKPPKIKDGQIVEKEVSGAVSLSELKKPNEKAKKVKVEDHEHELVEVSKRPMTQKEEVQFKDIKTAADVGTKIPNLTLEANDKGTTVKMDIHPEDGPRSKEESQITKSDSSNSDVRKGDTEDKKVDAITPLPSKNATEELAKNSKEKTTESLPKETAEKENNDSEKTDDNAAQPRKRKRRRRKRKRSVSKQGAQQDGQRDAQPSESNPTSIKAGEIIKFDE